MVSLSLWCINSNNYVVFRLPILLLFCFTPSSLPEQFFAFYCVQKCSVSFCFLFTRLHKTRIRCLSIFLSAERHGLRIGALVQFCCCCCLCCFVSRDLIRVQRCYGLLLIMLWVHFVTLLVCRSFVSNKQLF